MMVLKITYFENNDGFTLIEVIVVGVIISILMISLYQFFGFTYRTGYVGIDEQQIEDQVNNFFITIAKDIRNLESSKNILVYPNQLIIFETDSIIYEVKNNNIERNNKIIVRKINNYIIEPPLFEQTADPNIINITVNLKRNDSRTWSTSIVKNFSTQISRRNPLVTPLPSP